MTYQPRTSTRAPRYAALAACAAIAVPAVDAAAQTAEPAPSPALVVIHAYYVPATGSVYRIKAPGLPDDCQGPATGAKQHVPFSWNQQGPAGPQGPQGIPGPQGPAGAAGTGSAMDPIILFDQINIAIDPLKPQTFTQACPSGRRVIDRGYLLLDPSGAPLANPAGVTVIGDAASAPAPSAFDRRAA